MLLHELGLDGTLRERGERLEKGVVIRQFGEKGQLFLFGEITTPVDLLVEGFAGSVDGHLSREKGGSKAGQTTCYVAAQADNGLGASDLGTAAFGKRGDSNTALFLHESFYQPGFCALKRAEGQHTLVGVSSSDEELGDPWDSSSPVSSLSLSPPLIASTFPSSPLLPTEAATFDERSKSSSSFSPLPSVHNREFPATLGSPASMIL